MKSAAQDAALRQRSGLMVGQDRIVPPPGTLSILKLAQ